MLCKDCAWRLVMWFLTEFLSTNLIVSNIEFGILTEILRCLKTDLVVLRNLLVLLFKGSLDKYNIYLFIPNSIEYFKLNKYRNFQLILPMRFHFMRYFVNSIIEVVFEKLEMLEIYAYFFKSKSI